MAVHVPTRESTMRGQRPYLSATVLPAPINGMDGRLNLASNDPMFCVYAYNIVPTEYGMRTRPGYREWQTGIESVSSVGVRTLIPYHGRQEASSDDRLFAVTNEGIWDITTDGGTPTLVQAFADTSTANAGWATYAHYVQQDGSDLVYVADEQNGLYQFDPTATPGTEWSRPAITGVTLENVVHVAVHKQRVWLTERDTTTGYYLPIASSGGAATPFFFGSKFRHGGDLVGLYNWTLDSGAGVDDYLVAISRAGDVIPWQGEDPSNAVSWATLGTFYIGDVPIGRRVASEYGGDLHVLSSVGLTAMSDLLSGANPVTEGGEASQKVGRFLRNDLRQYLNDYGWELRFNNAEGVMLVNTPVRTGGGYLQYRMHMALRAWAFWRDVPMLTGEPRHGDFMFGTADNRVCRMDTTLDDVKLDGSGGTPVEFSILWNFLNMEQPGLFKWGEFLRPNWLSTREPVFEAKWVYDYNTAELPETGYTSVPDEALWDTALWDNAVWTAGGTLSFWELQGSWGPGRTMSVALRGVAYERTTLVSVDGMWRAAGPF